MYCCFYAGRQHTSYFTRRCQTGSVGISCGFMPQPHTACHLYNLCIALIRHSFRFLLMIFLSISFCLSMLCPLSLSLQLILGLLQRSVPLLPRGNLLLELPTGEPSAQWLGPSLPFNSFPIYLTAVGPV